MKVAKDGFNVFGVPSLVSSKASLITQPKDFHLSGVIDPLDVLSLTTFVLLGSFENHFVVPPSDCAIALTASELTG